MPQALQQGSSGPDVRLLQRLLNARPPSALPPLVLSGDFDAATAVRLREFQGTNGLVNDGYAGPVTWGALLGSFFVLGRHLYDRTGTRVLLRGVNKMCFFDSGDPDGVISFEQIRQTGANAVRIVWRMANDDGSPTDAAWLDRLLSNARQQHLIPIIELHDTSDLARLPELAGYWSQPQIVQIVQKHAEYLLLNIGNEVGDETVTEVAFIPAYTAAIKAIRTAGIHTPLVIDAPEYGKNLEVLSRSALPLLNVDDDRNLLFSVHPYWAKTCGYDAQMIRQRFQDAVSRGYALIAGEFCQVGGDARWCGFPQSDQCSPESEVDYQAILEICHENEIGWLAWEWGPGNCLWWDLANDRCGKPCPQMDMTADRTCAGLKPGWASEVALTSPYGIRSTSRTPPSLL